MWESACVMCAQRAGSGASRLGSGFSGGAVSIDSSETRDSVSRSRAFLLWGEIEKASHNDVLHYNNIIMRGNQ